MSAAVSEFGLIQQYFASNQPGNLSTSLGIGDDCALLNIPHGYELAITTDTMVEGVHFLPNTDPECLAHKLLAVNLSDLASMGANPIAVTLAITLPVVDRSWLKRFSSGLFALAQQYSVDLIGGDTTSGSLTLTIQALGLVKAGQALRRSGAKVGDLIYVSGCLGDAGLGLKIAQGYQCQESAIPLQRFHKPMPRVETGLALLEIASACIDISDGLSSDLGHILDKSAVGACLDWQKIPLSSSVQDYVKTSSDWLMPLTAGDDYELCFTVAPEKIELIPESCSQIGVIEQQPGLRIKKSGKTEIIEAKGFEHFSK